MERFGKRRRVFRSTAATGGLVVVLSGCSIEASDPGQKEESMSAATADTGQQQTSDTGPEATMHPEPKELR